MFEINPGKKKKQLETGRKGVEAEFVKQVRLNGGKAFKFVSEMNRGVSDRIVTFPGQAWFVEIKRTHGKLSPLQEKFRDYIKSLGLNHYVIYGVGDIQNFLEVVYARAKR